MSDIVESVIAEIKKDIENEDTTALYEMLSLIRERDGWNCKILLGYLPEEETTDTLTEEQAIAVMKAFTAWMNARDEHNPRKATLSLWIEYNYREKNTWCKKVHNSIDLLWEHVWA